MSIPGSGSGSATRAGQSIAEIAPGIHVAMIFINEAEVLSGL
jgi:hypothetical protein